MNVVCKDCKEEKPHMARGLCNSCYTRFYRKDGKVDRSKEKLIKALCHPENRPYNRGKCEPCYRKELREKQSPERKEHERQKRREIRIKTRYGISINDYNILLIKQNNKCYGCNQLHLETDSKTRLNIDHNHTTGKVRGLLCSNCNSTLGYANDNITTLSNLILYLKDHGDYNE